MHRLSCFEKVLDEVNEVVSCSLLHAPWSLPQNYGIWNFVFRHIFSILWLIRDYPVVTSEKKLEYPAKNDHLTPGHWQPYLVLPRPGYELGQL